MEDLPLRLMWISAPVLDTRPQASNLHELLAKWRHIAHLVLRDPGATYRMLAKAEQIQRSGHNREAAPVDLQALIRQRLAHQVVPDHPDTTGPEQIAALAPILPKSWSPSNSPGTTPWGEQPVRAIVGVAHLT